MKIPGVMLPTARPVKHNDSLHNLSVYQSNTFHVLLHMGHQTHFKCTESKASLSRTAD